MTKCPKREIPAMSSINDFETLKNLIFYKEIAEIKSLATAFGQRYMLEGALQYLADCSHPSAKVALQASIHLHLLHLVQTNLAWYQINGVIGEEAAAKINDEVD